MITILNMKSYQKFRKKNEIDYGIFEFLICQNHACVLSNFLLPSVDFDQRSEEFFDVSGLTIGFVASSLQVIFSDSLSLPKIYYISSQHKVVADFFI